MAKIYSTKDNTIGYVDCFMCANHAVAKRMFGEFVNNPKSQLNKYPEDYELYAIADFNEDVGIAKGYESPELVVRARELLKVSEK